jgi:hypothetical protein
MRRDIFFLENVDAKGQRSKGSSLVCRMIQTKLFLKSYHVESDDSAAASMDAPGTALNT